MEGSYGRSIYVDRASSKLIMCEVASKDPSMYSVFSVTSNKYITSEFPNGFFTSNNSLKRPFSKIFEPFWVAISGNSDVVLKYW